MKHYEYEITLTHISEKKNKSLVKKLFFLSYVKMGKEFLKFGEVEIEKQEFHSSKSAITINNIHSSQNVANTI